MADVDAQLQLLRSGGPSSASPAFPVKAGRRLVWRVRTGHFIHLLEGVP